MTYVIDTSVAFKWAIAETDSDKAISLRDNFRNGIHQLLAPDLFPTEIANSLLVAERRSRIQPGDWPVFFNDIMRYCPILFTAVPNLVRSYEIASLIQASIYDSLYVALAESESCEFVTAEISSFERRSPIFRS